MSLTQLLETPPLAATVIDAARIAHELYGLVGEAVQLPGERDCNFRVIAESGPFMLKIGNPAESLSSLDMQQRALLHIRRWDPGLPVAQPEETLQGALVGSATIGGTTAGVTLSSFLDGSPLEDTEASPQLRASTVDMLASVDLALRTFNHPALDRPLAWDLRMLTQLGPQLDYLDGATHEYAAAWLRHFESHVSPRLRRMSTQAVHNDFNPANLLVDAAGEGRICGILDFGDMTLGTRVGDLAVAAAYQCLGEDDLAGILVAAAHQYNRRLPLPTDDLELLPDLAISRLVQSLIISAWRAGLHPDNRDYILIHAEPVGKALSRLTALDLDALRHEVVAACQPVRRAPPGTEEAQQLRRARLAPGLRLTYRTPLHAASAESVWITDRNGVRHLDAYNNVAHVGHGHLEVVAAMTAQAARLNTNTRYLVDEVNEYADRLATMLPDPLDTVFFANSGSEANDLAWRIARTVTGRRGIIVTEHAYHGSTSLTMATSPEELGIENIEPWVATIVPPKRNAAVADSVAAAFERLARGGVQPAAFACDTVFSSDGIHDLAPGYLALVYAAVREDGGLCIADEVQAGLGRVGQRMWGFAADTVVPDIVTLGKPLGNGHPMAAVVTTSAIAEDFANDGYYFSTFAGNPVSAAVGNAVLDVMEREQLPIQAEVIGRYLREGIGELALRHEIISEVRGPGLFIGVELVGNGAAATSVAERVQNNMRERQVLIGRTGPAGNVLKIRPPLVFAEEHSDLLLKTLEDVLENL